MYNTFNIIIAGVGGQGGLTASRIIAEAAVTAGHHAVIGEIFGASRRGGSVFTHIRLSEQEVGPLVPVGELDLLIGLEPLEALRAAVHYGSSRTTAFVSTCTIQTITTMAGKDTYPSLPDILQSIHSICGSVFSIDPLRVLPQSQLEALNVFMIGVACQRGAFHIEPIMIENSVSHMSGQSEVNLSAFRLGMQTQLEQVY